MTNEQIKEIAKKIQTSNYNYDFIGIRVQEENTNNIGDTIYHKSYVWDDGNITDEELNGICAIEIQVARKLIDYGGYQGKYAYILGSDYCTKGNDVGEIIMKDAIVLDVIIVD